MTFETVPDSQSVALQSKEHGDILNVIDELRSLGISHYVDLPQVIVCGDQSSGKSSVLEAISGIQFPRKDNLCTRFATEVVLRRGPSESIQVSIVPGSERSEDEKLKMSEFTRSNVDLSEIENLISEATKTIGIDSFFKNFSNDILKFEVTGPTQPQLTLVDLPGLFQAGNKSQSDDDAKAVTDLVQSYMKRTRSIILAVVSAKNDFANQIVTKYAREIDAQGNRTLAIITKPDTLHVGSDSETSYVELAENKDVEFLHGWHVLKNRDYDTRFASTQERDEAEEDFFSHGLWSRLPREHVGISSLRSRLSFLLRDQILNELPSLLQDVQKGVKDCKEQLVRLGESRATVPEQRLHLLHASQKFTSLINSAIDGTYQDHFFGSPTEVEGRKKRFRAVVQNLMIDFSRIMREEGHAKHIVEDISNLSKKLKNDPRVITRNAFVEEALDLMKCSRGRELPGTYNPYIIGDLFYKQSRPWESLAHQCIDRIWDSVLSALDLILEHVTDDKTVIGLKQHVIDPGLEDVKKAVHRMVRTVLEPHQQGHPITYNHYLTENIQKLREDQDKKRMAESLNRFFNVDMENGAMMIHDWSFNVQDLLKALAINTVADMDRYACSEAVDCMRAYYKVAMKTFVDNIGVLVVENCLVQRLPGLFAPELVVSLDDSTTTSIAAEEEGSKRKRVHTNSKLKVLENALGVLKKLKLVRGQHSENFEFNVYDETSHKRSSSTTGPKINGDHGVDGEDVADDIPIGQDSPHECIEDNFEGLPVDEEAIYEHDGDQWGFGCASANKKKKKKTRG